jgi:hypothetical protein
VLLVLALLFAVVAPLLLREMRPLEARRVGRDFLLRSPEVRALLGEDVRTVWSLSDFLIRVELAGAIRSEQGFGLQGARGTGRGRVLLCRPELGAAWRVSSARIERDRHALELKGDPC